MIPMNKVEVAAYRYLGCAGSCFTLFQSVIWLILSLLGVTCYYARCGYSTSNMNTFKYCFHMLYFFESKNKTTIKRVNYLHPSGFHVVMWVSVAMCTLNIVLSVFTAKAFIQWKNPIIIRRMTYIWTRFILFASAWEFIMFLIFAVDLSSLNQNEKLKSEILKLDLIELQSASIPKLAAAPYLLQLKSDMKTMRKKLRKYNRNLKVLDAAFNEENPNHMKNPFISKSVVKNYVEDIWTNMFNNSICEQANVRRKKADADAISRDEVMKNFVIGEHLELDDMDYDLLKNFDGLTNNKFMKPIPSGNIIIGRQFNLSSHLTTDDSPELDKMTSLLREFLEKDNPDKPDKPDKPSNYSLPDENFEELFNDILDELEEQEPHIAYNKDELKSVLKKINLLDKYDNLSPLDNEDVLLSLRNFFDNMTSQEEKEEKGRESGELDDKNIQMVMDKMKDFVENTKETNTEKNIDFERLNNVKVSVTSPIVVGNRRDDEFKLIDNIDQDYSRKSVDTKISNAAHSLRSPVKKDLTVETDGNFLFNSISQHCAYFILSASILCMVFALKMGIVWIFNIIIAVLVLYYGNKAKLKTRHKFFPCLHKSN